MRSLKEILQDIDETDWSRLHHAYGEASDVPGMLRGLASDDEDVWAEAPYELCGTIWHQGTVYEASPHAVPFLLELLRSPEVSGKEGIALLVAELADGTALPLDYAPPLCRTIKRTINHRFASPTVMNSAGNPFFIKWKYVIG
jgi:hypothetical protein